MNQRSNRENTGEYREDHPKWEFSTRLALQCPEQNRGCHSEHDDSPRQVTAGMNPRRTNKKGTVPRFRAFFLARRRESTNLINPVIRSERGPDRLSVPGPPQTGLRLRGGVRWW